MVIFNFIQIILIHFFEIFGRDGQWNKSFTNENKLKINIYF